MSEFLAQAYWWESYSPRGTNDRVLWPRGTEDRVLGPGVLMTEFLTRGY